MKNLINITLLGIFWLSISFQNKIIGQQCTNDASTNPLAPNNNDPLFDNWENLWLNSFDFGKNNGFNFSLIKLNPSAGWTDAGLNDVDTLKMFNPFSNGATPNAPYLTNPASDFILRDFHWEDGWELLYLGTGFYPNNAPINLTPPNSFINEGQQVINGRIPYMIYYNRYTSIVRVFLGVFVPFGAAQDLTVDLGLNRSLNPESDLYYNGILRHLNTYDSPLDQITTVDQQRGVNSTGLDFNIRKWYSFDFQIGFDPCICQNPSVLDLDISLVEESTMKLYGRMITIEDQLSDAAGNPIYNQDFLTASSIEEQDPNGYILQKSLDGLIRNYKTSLEKYESELEDRQFGRSEWFQGLLQGSADAIIGGAIGTLPSAISANWIKKKKMVVGADTTSSTDGLNADVASYVNGATKALLGGGYNYLSSQVFGDNKEPVRPSRPVASFSEMRFTGKIEKTNTTSLSGFLTPGSTLSGQEITAHNYPAYNEVLGLYATLKTPQNQLLNKIDLVTEEILRSVSTLDSNITLTGGCFVNITGYTLDSTVWKSRTVEQDIFFKLKEPLKHALNAAVDINQEKTQVYVSYIVTLETGQIFTLPNLFTNYLLLDSLVVEEDESTNLWILHDLSQNTTPSVKGTMRKVQLSSGWYEVENVANLLFGSKLKTSLYYREKFEEFTPLCGVNYSFDSNIPPIQNAGLPLNITKVEMKVMADMYFDQLSFTGEEINTTQVFTYLLKDTELGIDLFEEQDNYIALSEEDAFVKMYPGELTIESNVISDTSPEVSYIDQNLDIVIGAENLIIDTIVESVIVVPPSDGPLVRIDAHEQIHLKPGAHIKPNINLRINKEAYGVAPSQSATATELSEFCSSNVYNAQVYLAPKSHATAQEAEELNLEPQQIRISIYPNPARTELTIKTQGAGIDQLTIYDMATRPVMQASPGGQTLYRMEIGALSPGVYIVRASCGDKVFTEKLVVAK